MKKITKRIIEFVSALFGSSVLGVFGLMFGMGVGGNYGFFQFKGLVGYESGGVIFSLFGISLGAILVLLLALKFLKEKGSYWGAAVMCGLSLLLNLILYDYNMSSWLMIIMWILPAVLVVLGFNYRNVFEKK
jgi:hypothetical protein